MMFLNLINILLLTSNVFSHMSFYPNILQYSTSSTRIALKTSHSCKLSTTNKINTIFPDGFIVKPEFKQGWTILFDTKSSLNITWVSNSLENNIPNQVNDLFWLWIIIPSNFNNNSYYSPTIQYCYPFGSYEWTYPSITPPIDLEPAPSFIISSIPSIIITNNITDIDNYYNINNWIQIYNLIISISIISIISLLMNIYNEYRIYNKKIEYSSITFNKLNEKEMNTGIISSL